MNLNHIYKFDMNTLFSNRINDGVLKCTSLLCERAREVVSKRDSLLIEQIGYLKDSKTKIEELLCIIDFSSFKKYHNMADLIYIKEIELKIRLLDDGIETKKEKTIIVRDFLKSNSMSKDCQVYYINSKATTNDGNNLYDELVPRVFFDFYKQNTVLSKLYAYSGTLCSDCNLLSDVKFNDDEIVVVKDKNYMVKADCITMISLEFLYNELKKIKGYFDTYKNCELEKILEFNACLEFESLYNSMNSADNKISDELKNFIKEYHDIPKNDKEMFKNKLVEMISKPEYVSIDTRINEVKWERIIAKKYPFDLNMFDGEGLISTELCSEIRESLCKKLGNNKYKNSTSFQIRMPYVKGMVHSCDFKKFFKSKGIEFVAHTIYSDNKKYDINKVKMILTESQFKLDAFIKDKNSIIKSVSDYVNLLNEYNYSFGVIDANKEEKKYCSLEYQFISTLPLNKKDIYNLYSDVKYKINEDCCGDNIVKALEKEDTTSAKEELDMYKLNKDFYFSTHRYSMRKHKIFNRLKDKALFSKFDVHGTRRYLSSNLLELLYHIAFEDYKQYPKDEWLFANQFYMPTNETHYNNAVFLRSPHYSRNEIVFLNRRPTILQKELEEYFSHLTGVVMINPVSLSADRLGGADYDGDTVLVVNDKNIISPVIRDLVDYVDNKINYKYLPCKIPSLKGRKMHYESYEDRLTCLQNTFSSRVGMLSNEALSIASSVYNTNDMSKHMIMPEYTILNGLEIDSAKTGKKPLINSFAEKDEYINDFLEYKKEFDENSNTIGVKDFVDSLPEGVYDIWHDYEDTNINYGYNILSILCNMNKIELNKEECLPYQINTSDPKNRVKALAIATIYSNFNKLVRRVFTSKARKVTNERLSRIYTQLEYICNSNNIDLEKLLDSINIDNLEAFKLINKYVKDNQFHFMEKVEDRRKYLTELFDNEDGIMLDSLSNFDNDGFRLLFLVLNYYTNKITNVKLVTSSEGYYINKKINEFSNVEKQLFNELYKSYEDYINKYISKNMNESDEDIKKNIISYLKEESKELTIDDIGSVIKLNNSNMVFDVFFDIVKKYMEVSNG